MFHFTAVPEPLSELMRGRERLEIPLDEAAVRRIRVLARSAERYWQEPSAGMLLCYEHVLLELSLLLFEAHTPVPSRAAPGPRPGQSARERVNRALQHVAAHMQANPSLEDIARVVGVSPVHLRRLFQEVLFTGPKQIFDQLRFQRAMQLMADPALKLEAIGEACGFQSASAFSRAFKLKFGCSPQAWRG